MKATVQPELPVLSAVASADASCAPVYDPTAICTILNVLPSWTYTFPWPDRTFLKVWFSVTYTYLLSSPTVSHATGKDTASMKALLLGTEMGLSGCQLHEAWEPSFRARESTKSLCTIYYHVKIGALSTPRARRRAVESASTRLPRNASYPCIAFMPWSRACV